MVAMTATTVTTASRMPYLRVSLAPAAVVLALCSNPGTGYTYDCDGVYKSLEKQYSMEPIGADAFNSQCYIFSIHEVDPCFSIYEWWASQISIKGLDQDTFMKACRNPSSVGPWYLLTGPIWGPDSQDAAHPYLIAPPRYRYATDPGYPPPNEKFQSWPSLEECQKVETSTHNDGYLARCVRSWQVKPDKMVYCLISGKECTP